MNNYRTEFHPSFPQVAIITQVNIIVVINLICVNYALECSPTIIKQVNVIVPIDLICTSCIVTNEYWMQMESAKVSKGQSIEPATRSRVATCHTSECYCTD